MGVIKNIHITIDGIEVKRCSMCGEKIPLSDFYRNSKAWDGVSTCCNTCVNAYARKWKAKRHTKGKGRGASYKHVEKDGVICKMCSKCMEIRPLDEFCVNRTKWDGHGTICKMCSREYDNKRYRERCLL